MIVTTSCEFSSPGLAISSTTSAHLLSFQVIEGIRTPRLLCGHISQRGDYVFLQKALMIINDTQAPGGGEALWCVIRSGIYFRLFDIVIKYGWCRYLQILRQVSPATLRSCIASLPPRRSRQLFSRNQIAVNIRSLTIVWHGQLIRYNKSLDDQIFTTLARSMECADLFVWVCIASDNHRRQMQLRLSRNRRQFSLLETKIKHLSCANYLAPWLFMGQQRRSLRKECVHQAVSIGSAILAPLALLWSNPAD